MDKRRKDIILGLPPDRIYTTSIISVNYVSRIEMPIGFKIYKVHYIKLVNKIATDYLKGGIMAPLGSYL